MRSLLVATLFPVLLSCAVQDDLGDDCLEGKCDEIYYGCDQIETSEGLPVLDYFENNFSRYLRRENPSYRVFTFALMDESLVEGEEVNTRIARSVAEFLGYDSEGAVATTREAVRLETGTWVQVDVELDDKDIVLVVDSRVTASGGVDVIAGKTDCQSVLRCDGAYRDYAVSGQTSDTVPVTCVAE